MIRNVLVERTSTGNDVSSLPEDLLADQCARVQMLHALGLVLWSINFVMDISLAPSGDRGPYRLVIESLGALLAAAAVGATRFGRCDSRRKITVGLALMVPHAFALGLLNSWTPQPTTMRPLSGITVLILIFGMLAPARPSTTLVTALIAASMDPLCVWLAHLRGLPVPSVPRTLVLFYPNYVCALLAVAPARLLYRLGGEIRAARALGSYELVELLGRGGMGEVWRARHRFLARHAAVKIVPAAVLGDGGATTALSRFEREAHATASLTSPHTIRVFDFGSTREGTFYYAMELLDGVDLETLIREFGPVPPARALHIIRQVCQSLAEAHASGVVHRDIKPANIYVCRMGLEFDFVKVLDFGLVKLSDPEDTSMRLTVDPVIMGTPAYMAPEVILGNGRADHRADLYSLGCVAYFLLTGRRPFEADHAMKVLMQHVQDEAAPPSHRSELPIPRSVDDLVLMCLKKDPSDRPQDASDLQHRAAHCSGVERWDPRASRQWWEAHLPDLAKPRAIALPRGDQLRAQVSASPHAVGNGVTACRMEGVA